MKNAMSIRIILTSLLVAPTLTHAKTSIPLVFHYDKSNSTEIWEAAKRDYIPASLVDEIWIDTPNRAFAAPYQNILLQNERVVVCEQTCDESSLKIDTRHENQTEKHYIVRLTNQSRGFKTHRTKRRNDRAIRLGTVYYWVNTLFDYLETLNWKPSRRLTAYVDRDARSPSSGSKMHSNAFFVGSDSTWTLSFLPTGKERIFKRLKKVPLASAADPSVVMHEAAHSVFEDIVGDGFNPELFGLHEAFADYFAMAVLNSPVIGRVMMRGHDVREVVESDSSEKTRKFRSDGREAAETVANETIPSYELDLESHALGRVIANALWNIRRDFSNRISTKKADKIVLNTLRKLGRQPLALSADVVRIHLQEIETELKNESDLEILLDQARKHWKHSGLVRPDFNLNLDELKNADDPSTWMTISVKEIYPKSTQTLLGVPASTQGHLTLYEVTEGPELNFDSLQKENESTEDQRTSIQSEWLKVGLIGKTPYWLLLDPETGNLFAAVDAKTYEVVETQQDAIQDLMKFNEVLPSLMGWIKSKGALFHKLHKGRGLMGLLKGGPARLLYRPGRSKRTQIFRKVNGVERQIDVTSFRPRRNALNRLIGLILGRSERATLRSLKRVDLYSTPLKTDQLPGFANDEDPNRLLGYATVRKTGLTTSVLITEIH